MVPFLQPSTTKPTCLGQNSSVSAPSAWAELEIHIWQIWCSAKGGSSDFCHRMAPQKSAWAAGWCWGAAEHFWNPRSCGGQWQQGAGAGLIKVGWVPSLGAWGCHQPLLSPGAELGSWGTGSRGLGSGLAANELFPLQSPTWSCQHSLGLFLDKCTFSEVFGEMENFPGAHWLLEQLWCVQRFILRLFGVKALREPIPLKNFFSVGYWEPELEMVQIISFQVPLIWGIMVPLAAQWTLQLGWFRYLCT